MAGGYAGRILFVDLSKKEVRQETLEEKTYRDFLGGYGLGAKVIFSRQKAGVDPLGAESMFGFLAGLLTGTGAIVTSRCMLAGKSPLTGTWGDANMGGDFGPHLKFAGYDGVFFTGASEKPAYLFIEDGTAEIRDAEHLWGKDTSETEDILKSELGQGVRVASIGPAGEKLSLISGVISHGRVAARSGFGAVMGSKKLKAVAVKGTMKVPLADRKKFKDVRGWSLRELAGPAIEKYKKFGTVGAVAQRAAIGLSPCKNWGGVGAIDFPNAQAISDVNFLNREVKRTSCYRCPIACHATLKKGTEYQYLEGTEQPEYETTCAFGTMCLNDNIESIVMLNDICNRYGLDTISTGSTIAFAIECYENELITKNDTDGIELRWGGYEAIVAMTEKLANREGFGDILADGTRVAAMKIGKGAEEYAMNVHGQELPMADPRFAPSFGTTYVTAATPARHMKGGAEWVELASAPHGTGFPPVERYVYTGKGEAHAWMRKCFHVADNAGYCLFAVIGLPVDAITKQLAAVTGWEYSIEEMLMTGERIACVCQAFNVREGIRPRDFKLPARVVGKPPLKEGPLANVTLDIDNMAKEFFEAMEWDFVTGKPSKTRLHELGLEEVAREL